MQSFENLLNATITRIVRDELQQALGAIQQEVASLQRTVAGSTRGTGRPAGRPPGRPPGRGPGRPPGRAAAKAAPAPKARRAAGQRGGRREAGTLTAKEVKAIRAKLGLSQARLARLAGVTPVAVYFWESGRTTPSLVAEEALLDLSRNGAPPEEGAAPKRGRAAGRGRRKAAARRR
jgi:DNA-binding transcriptional regulator YiaG